MQWECGGDPFSWPPSTSPTSTSALRVPLDGGGEGGAQGHGAPRQEGQGRGGRSGHPLSKASRSGDLVVRAEQPILV